MVNSFLRITRPRFWIYVLGPFLIGYIASIQTIQELFDPLFWLFFVYFTFPANILIYWVNDIFDYATDKLNTKKQWYEELLLPKQHKQLLQKIILWQLPFIFLALLFDVRLVGYLALFRFFGIFYSAKPIRAKAIPFLDGIFNVLYIVPALVGILLAWGNAIQRWVFVAAWLWCIAMHAYSAIPDIDADKEANIQTVATILWPRWTSWYCITLYIASGIIAGILLQAYWLIVVGVLYAIFVYFSYFYKRVFGYYKRFPLINMSVWFILFWWIVAQKWRG